MAKNHTVLVKIPVNDKRATSKKKYTLKIVVWSVVLCNDGHMIGGNMSVVIIT
jgi:methionine-rich copper-binding protein CopC